MTDIKYMQITVKTSGYVLDVNYNRPTPSTEFAYSDLDDLLNGLTKLLGPVVPISLHSPDGTIDDGWRVWEGEPRDIPPGVADTDIVEVRLADPNILAGVPQPARRWLWTWRFHGQRDDIVAYRVVKP